MRILIIDDQPDFRVMLATFLEDAGYQSVCASNGRDALTYLRCCIEPPALILLDLAMPVMTGWDFLREQQRDATLAAIPVVLITARDDVRHEGMTFAPSAYLQKPLDLDTLLATIRQPVAPEKAKGQR